MATISLRLNFCKLLCDIFYFDLVLYWNERRRFLRFNYHFVLGGQGGLSNIENGRGGWSYFNPASVLKVIGPNMGLPKCVEDSNLQIKDETDPVALREAVPSLCKVVGDGIVQILSPSKHTESLCHGNCSSKGAKCVALDMDAKIGRCLCPNGIILDHLNPQCSNGKIMCPYI